MLRHTRDTAARRPDRDGCTVRRVGGTRVNLNLGVSVCKCYVCVGGEGGSAMVRVAMCVCGHMPCTHWVGLPRCKYTLLQLTM